MPVRPPLAAPRLLLREPLDGDAAALRDYHRRNEQRITRWEPRRSDDVAAHAAWVAYERGEIDAGRAGAWLGFVHDAPGDLAALVQLDAISASPARSAMLSYSVDAAYEGRGYAREACQAVIAFAFGDLAVEELSATYDPANERSGALLTRLGFVEVARTVPVPGYELLMRAQVLAVLRR